MTHPLSKLEARVEGLIEGTFARWFAEHLHPKDVAVQLARALEDSATHGAPGSVYLVYLHPADAQTLLGQHPDLTERLSDDLVTIAREIGLTLATRPEVRLVPDSKQALRAITVKAERRLPDEPTTLSMTPLPVISPEAQTIMPPAGAFLILEGARTIPLAHAIINLGRRTDNHIIVDDARVSRSHAQLRLRFGHYVLYDLGSSGGTFVNGQRIQECILRPGDVIALGGVPVIYGEDEMEEDSSFKIQDSKLDGQTRPA